MAVAICRFAGASRVFATDVMPHRREMAARMGSDCVLDGAGDVVAEIRRETGGTGVDVVLEMSGAESAIHQAFEMTTNGGRVSLLGLPSRPVTLDLNDAIIFRGRARLRHHRPRAVAAPGTRPRRSCARAWTSARSSPTGCR